MSNTKKFKLARVLHYLVAVLFALYTFWVILSVLGSFFLMLNPHSIWGKLAQSTFLLEFKPTGNEHPYQAVIHDSSSSVHMDLMGYFTVNTTNRLYYVVCLLFDLFYGGLYILVLHQLRLIFGSIDEGNPFARENIRRIRLLGGGLIGAEFLRIGFEYMVMVYTKGLISVQGGEIFYLNIFFYLEWLNLGIIFAGLAILGIAEVFSVGVQFREEHELTI